MAGNDRDVAQTDADPIGPPGHAGGTYGEKEQAKASRRSEFRETGDDATVEEQSPLRDDVNAKAAKDLDY